MKARNLNAETRREVPLFQGITRHNVAWMWDVDRTESLNGSERAKIVEEIVW